MSRTPLMKKSKLTPVQGCILQMLGEAGEESLATIEATLQSLGKGDERIMDDAIEALEHLGFISRTDSDITLTESGAYALTH
jgi:hypothetical protein